MIHRVGIVALAVALIVRPLAAQHDAPPAPGTPENFTLPAKDEFRLSNGLAVTLVPYGTLPKAVVRLVVRTGKVDEGPEQVWLADVTGAMLLEGTRTRDAQAIAADAASLGGELEVDVGPDQTMIGGEALAEFTPELVRLIADVVRHPAFPERELERVKADHLRQLSIARTQPDELAAEKFRSVLYGDHPYGRTFPTDAMLGGYGVDDVRGFHRAHFGAARAHLYVAGRFQPQAVRAAVREAFGGWERGRAPRQRIPDPRSARQIHIVDRPGAPQTTIYLGLPVVDPSHEDYIPLLVTNALLGGAFSSRITSNIREDKGYTYSPFSQVSVRYRDAYWAEVADVTTAVTGASLKEIFYEIERLRETPPPAKELQGIQNYVAGVFVLQNSSRVGIVGQLSFVDLHGLPDRYLTEWVSRVNRVRPADIQRIARTYLRPDEMAIVLVGDRAVIEEQVASFAP